MKNFFIGIQSFSFSYYITKKKRHNNCKKFIINKKNYNYKNFIHMNVEKNQNEKINRVLKLNEISDKLTHLLSLEKVSESIPNEDYKGHLESTLHIAVVFTKHLIKDQISLEFSRRISTVLTHIKYGKLKPDLIAFIGGYKGENKISGATSGYIYFRNLSSEAKIDLSGLKFMIEEHGSNSHENLMNLLANIKKKYGNEMIKKCHFTLISSDYHLIRISEIYKLSRRQSILSCLYKAGFTWTYLFAAYPFCVSPDPTLAFLGRIRVLANDLTIVLVNLNGLVENNDLIARENFSRLCETNRKLRSMLRMISEPISFLNYSNGSIEIPLEKWEILEVSLCSIYEVQSILTPLVNGKTVDRKILIHSRDLLMNTVKNVKKIIDPDRPLDFNNWYVFIEQIRNEKFNKKNNQ